jgi:hypothetical protein
MSRLAFVSKGLLFANQSRTPGQCFIVLSSANREPEPIEIVVDVLCNPTIRSYTEYTYDKAPDWFDKYRRENLTTNFQAGDGGVSEVREG